MTLGITTLTSLIIFLILFLNWEGLMRFLTYKVIQVNNFELIHEEVNDRFYQTDRLYRNYTTGYYVNISHLSFDFPLVMVYCSGELDEVHNRSLLFGSTIRNLKTLIELYKRTK